MTRRSASPFAAVLLAAQAMADGVPEWVHLIPAGPIRTVDGRSGFRWDGGEVQLLGFDGREKSPRVPVDVNHANAKLGSGGHETPAKGWIVALQVRPDGVWGRVEWNEAGRALVADKAYRGMSAELMVRQSDGLIIGIRGASLTNTPNLKGLQPIFNAVEEHDMNDLLKKLMAALGIGGEPDETAVEPVLNAVAALKSGAAGLEAQVKAIARAAGATEDAAPEAILQTVAALADPAKTVPAAVVAGLKAELHSVSAELKGLKETGLRDKATAFVDAAIARGHVGVKPLREHYIARHMTAAADVEKEIAALPVLNGTQIAKAPPKEGGPQLNDAEEAVARMMGIDPKAMEKTKAAIAADREMH